MPPEPVGAWRRLHPVTILRELLGVAWNLVVAVIVLGALQGGGFERLELLVPLVFFGVAVGRYYSTRYLITPDAVLWRRGILFRQRLEVPRTRIQNVSSGADVLGRIFGLRTVTVSTAGSEGEIELALVTSEEASFLLADLLGGSDPSVAPVEAGADTIDTTAPPAGPPLVGPPAPSGPPARWLPPPETASEPAITATTTASAGSSGSADAGSWPQRLPPSTTLAGSARPAPPPVRDLVQLSTRDLVVYAATGGGLGVALVAAVPAVALSVFLDNPRPLLFLAFVLAAPLFGTVDLVDFQLTGEADRIRVRHGLLKTRDKWARRERIQVVEVLRPVLRSALGFETISVATADAKVGGDSDLSLSAPLARRGHWPELAAELVEAPTVTEAGLRPISPRAELRRFVRLFAVIAVPSAVAALVVAVVGDPWWAVAVLVGGCLTGAVVGRVLARRAQRVDGYTLDDRHLLVRRGMVASRLWLVRRAKVQSVSVQASPFQRRLDLASLHVDTANVGGAAIIVPDLPRDEAERLAAELVEHADRVFLPDGV